MLSDTVDTKLEITPIETFLQRHDGDSLLQDDSPIHPELLQQCDFETDAHGNKIGEYQDPHSQVKATYWVFKSTNDFICSIQAPLKQWALWQETFPGEFVRGIQDNNPSNLPPVITKNQQYRVRNGKLDTKETCHLDFIAYLGKVGERKELVWMNDSQGLRRPSPYDI